MSNLDNNTFWLNTFKEYGESISLVWKNQEYTYNFLFNTTIYWIENLQDIHEGTIVALESDFTPQTISILFALIQKRCIIVPFDINNREKNIRKFEIAQIDYLIKVENENSITIEKQIFSGVKNQLYDLIKQGVRPGLVLFTSGSSGEPKGALHDFSKLLDKFKNKRKAYKTINFLLFDHWGGLNTLFHILSNGGSIVTLENRIPDYVCGLIEKHKVELLPTSPTFLNLMFLSKAYERFDISSLKIITYGAEPMPESLLNNLVKNFPNIQFQQTYGLIELGVMRSKSESNASLWVKIGGEGYQFRVVEGLLQVKAESAMLGYLNAPSPFTEDGWFMTGDAVETKGEYFRILGRKSELINVGGEKVFPQEIENVILRIPDIKDVLVFSEKHPFTGSIVCAKVQIKSYVDEKDIIKVIKTFCREQLASYKIPVKITITQESLHNDRFKKQRI